MPCSPDDINITEPDGPSLPAIPGFGVPFAPRLPGFPFPDGFPEDLNELWNTLGMILPPGTIKPSLNPNFGKDVFDAIMSLLDKFFPFLMLYKFFLPILNLIICIIEVLCALMNPFKLIRALKRLFRNCIPEFLSLFPIFALIVMLLSLLFLLLALIEYIITQILRIIQMLLRNIRALVKATQKADAGSLAAITKKLGILLCSFQNIFVILAIFAVIIQVIKDILKLLFKIPPCDDSDDSDTENCCTPEVCPDFIRNNEEFTRLTGTLQYYPKVGSGAGVLPFPLNTFTIDKRAQSYQLFDVPAPIEKQMINITDAVDITIDPKPVFFPSDVTYSAGTPVGQAPYKVDLRLLYNPASWGRPGAERYIRFKDCIVLFAPTRDLKNFDNSTSTVGSGVVYIAGGKGTEDNGVALLGFAGDGVTPTSSPATLENFLFTPAVIGTDPPLNPTDGYRFNNIEYKFKINHEVLLGKAMITLGCIPTVALDRTFVNTIFGGNSGVNFALLNALVNGAGFPDVSGLQQCLQNALNALRLNMSEEGVAIFKATTDACFGRTKKDAEDAIKSLIGIGYDPYKSDFTIDPSIQFTSKKIKVQVQLNEGNGISLTDNLPESVSLDMEQRLKAELSFGFIGPFKYDGSKLFESTISSDTAGSGTIKIFFDNKAISVVTIPGDINVAPSVAAKELPFSFIFTPTSQVGDTTILTGRGDTDGAPRRDVDDFSGDGSDGKGG